MRTLSTTSKRLLVAAIGLAVLAILVLIAHPWTYFGYHSVCVRTGMIRYSQQYGIFTRHRVEETPLSRVLIESGYRKPDDHEWEFAHGRGKRPRESGSGHALSMPSIVTSTELSSVVQRLIEFTDKGTAEKWVGRLLDPQVCWLASFQLSKLHDATNRADFLERLNASEESFRESEGDWRSSN